MNIENQFVKRVLNERYRVDLLEVKESDTKTPDFEVRRSGVRVAMLEVKNLEAVDPEKAPGWTRDGTFHTRPDNGPSRVAARIHDAFQQLKDYDVPKILAFVNDGDVDVGDLDEAVLGYMDYGTGKSILRNTISEKVAQGRIRDEKRKIDLYVWINRHLFGNPLIMEFPPLQPPRERVIKDEDLVQFRVATPIGANVLEEIFGVTLQRTICPV